MPLDFLSNFDNTVGRWAITLVGFILFMFLVARRRSMRRSAEKKPAFTQDDIVVDWGPDPGGQVTVQPWMRTDQVKAVLAAITRDGKEARFIGGCVRDTLLKRPVTDIDIATQEPPERVLRLLEDADIYAIPTGLKHGTVTAVAGGQSFEITTLRKDIKTDGRHAIVEFTDDWRLDAARRDFTFNTMSATPDGMVYDYFNGIQDLAGRVIRFVGRAQERIDEDRLRILRYFRFIAVLGMRIGDKYEFQICVNNARHLPELSGERIRAELFKILDSDDQFDALKLMIDHGVMQYILPEAEKTERLKRLMWLETSAIKYDSVVPDRIRRLAALIDTNTAGAGEIARRLRFSRADREHLKNLAEPRWKASHEAGEDALRGALHRLGAAEVIDLTLLTWAEQLIITPRLDPGEKDGWQSVIGIADAWTPVEFPLRGRDVLSLGAEEGPRVSELLSEVEDWWEEDGCHQGRETCLQELRRRFENSN
ncbi:MAG: CCA tRNA nucleotidyltransferase [Rhodospirillales bacterium]|jgi:poly(A) polymerase|nr:CCA tRNA nucleotidyltransferase [Rhodospirillales bacterium]MDP6841800.1 CCA tRNA nucleotidyltransferase [Rhodospirillales bacterium]